MKRGGLVDMVQINTKLTNEVVKSIDRNFAKETLQRDEDAEMKKFIEENIENVRNLKKSKTVLPCVFNQDVGLINTINMNISEKRGEILLDMPKYLTTNMSKYKSCDGLPIQILSGSFGHEVHEVKMFYLIILKKILVGAASSQVLTSPLRFNRIYSSL